MPIVGKGKNKKKFGYGKKAKKKAHAYAKRHGLSVTHKSNPGYYAENNNYKNRLYTALIELNTLER